MRIQFSKQAKGGIMWLHRIGLLGLACVLSCGREKLLTETLANPPGDIQWIGEGAPSLLAATDLLKPLLVVSDKDGRIVRLEFISATRNPNNEACRTFAPAEDAVQRALANFNNQLLLSKPSEVSAAFLQNLNSPAEGMSGHLIAQVTNTEGLFFASSRAGTMLLAGAKGQAAGTSASGSATAAVKISDLNILLLVAPLRVELSPTTFACVRAAYKEQRSVIEQRARERFPAEKYDVRVVVVSAAAVGGLMRIAIRSAALESGADLSGGFGSMGATIRFEASSSNASLAYSLVGRVSDCPQSPQQTILGASTPEKIDAERVVSGFRQCMSGMGVIGIRAEDL